MNKTWLDPKTDPPEWGELYWLSCKGRYFSDFGWATEDYRKIDVVRYAKIEPPPLPGESCYNNELVKKLLDVLKAHDCFNIAKLRVIFEQIHKSE